MNIDNFNKFVINLKRRPDRLELFKKRSPFHDVTVIEGFDGKNMKNEAAAIRMSITVMKNELESVKKASSSASRASSSASGGASSSKSSSATSALSPAARRASSSASRASSSSSKTGGLRKRRGKNLDNTKTRK